MARKPMDHPTMGLDQLSARANVPDRLPLTKKRGSTLKNRQSASVANRKRKITLPNVSIQQKPTED